MSMKKRLSIENRRAKDSMEYQECCDNGEFDVNNRAQRSLSSHEFCVISW
jgi:hypothetical protein